MRKTPELASLVQAFFTSSQSFIDISEPSQSEAVSFHKALSRQVCRRPLWNGIVF